MCVPNFIKIGGGREFHWLISYGMTRISPRSDLIWISRFTSMVAPHVSGLLGKLCQRWYATVQLMICARRIDRAWVDSYMYAHSLKLTTKEKFWQL